MEAAAEWEPQPADIVWTRINKSRTQALGIIIRRPTGDSKLDETRPSVSCDLDGPDRYLVAYINSDAHVHPPRHYLCKFDLEKAQELKCCKSKVSALTPWEKIKRKAIRDVRDYREGKHRFENSHNFVKCCTCCAEGEEAFWKAMDLKRGNIHIEMAEKYEKQKRKARREAELKEQRAKERQEQLAAKAAGQKVKKRGKINSKMAEETSDTSGASEESNSSGSSGEDTSDSSNEDSDEEDSDSSDDFSEPKRPIRRKRATPVRGRRLRSNSSSEEEIAEPKRRRGAKRKAPVVKSGGRRAKLPRKVENDGTDSEEEQVPQASSPKSENDEASASASEALSDEEPKKGRLARRPQTTESEDEAEAQGRKKVEESKESISDQAMNKPMSSPPSDGVKAAQSESVQEPEKVDQEESPLKETTPAKEDKIAEVDNVAKP